MNERMVLSWVAEELGTCLGILREDGIREYVTPAAGLYYPTLQDETLLHFVNSATVSKPHLFLYNGQYLFGCFRSETALYLLGPVLHSAAFHPRRGFAGEPLPEDCECRAVDFRIFCKAVIFLFEAVTGIRVDREDFFLENLMDKRLRLDVESDVTRVSLAHLDDPVGHHSMAPIKKLEDCIREGNVEMLVDALQDMLHADFGTTSEDAVRNAKNMSIAGITNVTRAAIEGGTPYLKAYALSDSYIYRFEHAADEDELSAIYSQACLHFAKLVAEHRSAMDESTPLQINYYTEKAKRYVSDHIGERIEVSAIADALKVSPNYLSALFKKTEHVTLTEYIMKRKINQAKRLLIYSELSCSDVAFRLGFSSQSHFGAAFRRETGMTPHHFAEQNRKIK